MGGTFSPSKIYVHYDMSVSLFGGIQSHDSKISLLFGKYVLSLTLKTTIKDDLVLGKYSVTISKCSMIEF